MVTRAGSYSSRNDEASKVSTFIIVAVVLLVVTTFISVAGRAHQRNVNASRQIVPMQQVTPAAQPSPVALAPVARPVVAAPAPTWTLPKPAASTAMSSDAPPAYAAYMGATSTATEDMFNADGTFK